MSRSEGRLAGKVALVTGASPNIGGTAAQAFAAQGAKVACSDLDPQVAGATAETIRRSGGEAIAVAGDVTDDTAMAEVVDKVIDRFGGIDVLVNNAASFRSGGILSMQVEDFRRQVDVILAGTFIVTQHVARKMVEAGKGGSIINVLSTTAWQGPSNNLGYASAKSALINFTRAVGMELAPHRIRVNGFTPTVTIPEVEPNRTAMLAAIDDMRTTDGTDFVGLLPWHRLPTPSDYVGGLVFLASDESELMTGSNLNIDGGALAQYWPQVPRQHVNS